MYSTVINSHPTVIKHQIPQPTNIGVQTEVAKAFAINPAETLADKKIKSGYSIPIKIESGAINDPTLASYETPNFIHKKDTIINGSGVGSSMGTFVLNPEVYLKKHFQEDINNVIAELDKSKDKEEKLSVCNFIIYFKQKIYEDY